MSSLLQSTNNTRVLPTGTNQYYRSDFPESLTDKEMVYPNCTQDEILPKVVTTQFFKARLRCHNQLHNV